MYSAAAGATLLTINAMTVVAVTLRADLPPAPLDLVLLGVIGGVGSSQTLARHDQTMQVLQLPYLPWPEPHVPDAMPRQMSWVKIFKSF